MTEQEKAYAKLDMQYKEKFGEFYPVEFGDKRSSEDHMRIMKECIKSGNPHVISDTGTPEGILI